MMLRRLERDESSVLTGPSSRADKTLPSPAMIAPAPATGTDRVEDATARAAVTTRRRVERVIEEKFVRVVKVMKVLFLALKGQMREEREAAGWR